MYKILFLSFTIFFKYNTILFLIFVGVIFSLFILFLISLLLNIKLININILESSFIFTLKFLVKYLSQYTDKYSNLSFCILKVSDFI